MKHKIIFLSILTMFSLCSQKAVAQQLKSGRDFQVLTQTVLKYKYLVKRHHGNRQYSYARIKTLIEGKRHDVANHTSLYIKTNNAGVSVIISDFYQRPHSSHIDATISFEDYSESQQRVPFEFSGNGNCLRIKSKPEVILMRKIYQAERTNDYRGEARKNFRGEFKSNDIERQCYDLKY